MNDDVIKQNTGKMGAEWKRILDKFGTQDKSPERVKAYLVDCYNLNPWWVEKILVEYYRNKSL